jgi:signal transduction histidine kinase
MQTDGMLGLSRHVVEMPQKGSTTELTRANEAMRKCLDGLTSVAELDDFRGIGRRSMRERAAQIDALLEIQTGPGHGTRIIVTVPISL